METKWKQTFHSFPYFFHLFSSFFYILLQSFTHSRSGKRRHRSDPVSFATQHETFLKSPETKPMLETSGQVQDRWIKMPFDQRALISFVSLSLCSISLAGFELLTSLSQLRGRIWQMSQDRISYFCFNQITLHLYIELFIYMHI